MFTPANHWGMALSTDHNNGQWDVWELKGTQGNNNGKGNNTQSHLPVIGSMRTHTHTIIHIHT